MNEEENKQEDNKQDNPKEKQGLSIVEEAQKVRDEIKAENDRREQILKEEQKLRAEQMLAGTAGGNVKVEPKVMTNRENN